MINGGNFRRALRAHAPTANRLVAVHVAVRRLIRRGLLFRFGQFAVVVIEGKVQLLRLGRHSARTSEASSKSSSAAAQGSAAYENECAQGVIEGIITVNRSPHKIFAALCAAFSVNR